MTDHRAAPQESERKAARRIPPLVWIVIAALAAWFAITLFYRQGVHVTPHGGTMPEAQEGPAVIPAAPAQSGAPATPAGTVNGPAPPQR
jgi:hypothetical protein